MHITAWASPYKQSTTMTFHHKGGKMLAVIVKALSTEDTLHAGQETVLAEC